MGTQKTDEDCEATETITHRETVRRRVKPIMSMTANEKRRMESLSNTVTGREVAAPKRGMGHGPGGPGGGRHGKGTPKEQ